MHYPFTPTVFRGAPRADLNDLLCDHEDRAPYALGGDPAWFVAGHYALSMLREAQPENVYEVGTDLRFWHDRHQRRAAMNSATSVLVRHRSRVHGALLRAIEDGVGLDPCERAWRCASLHCNLVRP